MNPVTIFARRDRLKSLKSLQSTHFKSSSAIIKSSESAVPIHRQRIISTEYYYRNKKRNRQARRFRTSVAAVEDRIDD